MHTPHLFDRRFGLAKPYEIDIRTAESLAQLIIERGKEAHVIEEVYDGINISNTFRIIAATN